MIAAIDGRAGLPTDQPQVLTASPRGQQFSRELDSARQEPPAAPLERSPTKGAPVASRNTQARVAAQRQDRNAPAQPETPGSGAPSTANDASGASAAESSAGQDSPAANGSSTDESEPKAGRHDADISQTIIPDAAAVRSVAPPPPLTPAQAVGALPRDEQILSAPQGTISLAQAYAAGAQSGGTLQAQLGRAAYRLSPHSVNEPVPTLPHGRAPDAAAKSLQPADPEQQAGLVELHVVDVQEMVQLSNEARAAQVTHPDADLGTPGIPADASPKTAHVDPNSAQARNQLLAQIGGPAQGVPRPAVPGILGTVDQAFLDQAIQQLAGRRLGQVKHLGH